MKLLMHKWSLVVLTQKGLLEIVNASKPRNDKIHEQLLFNNNFKVRTECRRRYTNSLNIKKDEN